MTNYTVNTWIVFALIWMVSIPSVWANHRSGDALLPQDMAVADFNGDGHLDVAVANSGGESLSIMIGSGAGAFTLNGIVSVDTLPKHIQAGDVNEDGIVDLVVVNSWGYNISVYVGDGLGGFSFSGLFDNLQGFAISLQDFNHDGHLDIASTAMDEKLFEVALGNGLGGFGLTTEFSASNRTLGIASADFNGDTHMDLMLTLKKDNQIEIWLGDGLGGFSQKQVLAPSHIQVLSGVPADFNKDGFIDLVVGGGPPESEGRFFSILLGDGTGSFSVYETMLFGEGLTATGELALGDFNEDGHLDVGITTRTAATTNQNLSIYFGDGNGGVNPVPDLYTVGNEPHTIKTGDFNEDGHLDLAVSVRSDTDLGIMLGDGSGNFPSILMYALTPGVE